MRRRSSAHSHAAQCPPRTQELVLFGNDAKGVLGFVQHNARRAYERGLLGTDDCAAVGEVAVRSPVARYAPHASRARCTPPVLTAEVGAVEVGLDQPLLQLEDLGLGVELQLRPDVALPHVVQGLVQGVPGGGGK